MGPILPEGLIFPTKALLVEIGFLKSSKRLPRPEHMTSPFKLSPLSPLYTFTVAGLHEVSQQPAKKQPIVPTGLLPGSSYRTFSHHSVGSQATLPNSLSADHTEIKLGTEMFTSTENKHLGAERKAQWLI